MCLTISVVEAEGAIELLKHLFDCVEILHLAVVEAVGAMELLKLPEYRAKATGCTCTSTGGKV